MLWKNPVKTVFEDGLEKNSYREFFFKFTVFFFVLWYFRNHSIWRPWSLITDGTLREGAYSKQSAFKEQRNKALMFIEKEWKTDMLSMDPS